MIKEKKAKSVPVGFLDPQMMSLSTMNQDRSYVVDYVTKDLQWLGRNLSCFLIAQLATGF